VGSGSARRCPRPACAPASAPGEQSPVPVALSIVPASAASRKVSLTRLCSLLCGVLWPGGCGRCDGGTGERAAGWAARALPPHLSPLRSAPLRPALHRSVFPSYPFSSTHVIFAACRWFCVMPVGASEGSRAFQRPRAGQGCTALPRSLQRFTPAAKRTRQPLPALVSPTRSGK